MDALLTAIAIWISTNYGLPADFEHPRIERAPSVAMAGLREKGLVSPLQREASILETQDGPPTPRDVIAVYNDRTRTIHLLDRWSGRTPAELSVLVHEMVHHLQNEAGAAYECPAEREKLAYQAQDKWLSLFGTSLENEFKIDGFTLLISTSCAMSMGLH